MVFHEIYGSYYNVIAAVLAEAVDGTLNQKKVGRIINKKAFDESILNIPEKLIGGEWNLLTAEYDTPILEKPRMALTTIQKRWLKSLTLDPRIQLFDPDMTGLEDVTPLFTPDMIVYYDQNIDGDPFEETEYIHHFRLILKSLEEKTPLKIEYENARGKKNILYGYPLSLEYSQKDDKFRLVFGNEEALARKWVLNLSRIQSCEVMSSGEMEGSQTRERSSSIAEGSQTRKGQRDTVEGSQTRERSSSFSAGSKNGIGYTNLGNRTEVRTVTLSIWDERNALERMLLHFSHLEKETKKINAHQYLMKLTYDASDEVEMLIRILAFGPKVKVLEPEGLIEKIRERLRKQQERIRIKQEKDIVV